MILLVLPTHLSQAPLARLRILNALIVIVFDQVFVALESLVHVAILAVKGLEFAVHEMQVEEV